MATLRAIQNRIKSTGNIKQITKAMEAVSAVKMRKSEQTALSARPFAISGLEILRHLLSAPTINHESFFSPPLMKKYKTGPRCFIIIASDKGLAGSFNSNVLKKTLSTIKEKNFNPEEIEFITIGKKSTDAVRRKGLNIIKSFSGAGDYTSIEETAEIVNFIQDGFKGGNWRSVRIIYTNFLSALKQEVLVRKILPFHTHTFEEIIREIIPQKGRYANVPNTISDKEIVNTDYIFEPDTKEIIENLLPELLAVEIYHTILEANASEHSSRMIAMKSASDSAGELIDTLTIKFNNARQAAITKELIEITAGKEALNNAN